MKKLLLFSLTLMFSLFAVVGICQGYGNVLNTTTPGHCNEFHKKSCQCSPNTGFSYNGQSRSGLFSKGLPSTVKVVFFRGMDYHLSICAETKDKVNFIIKDVKTAEVLYDNSTDNSTHEIQITNENTRNVNIMITPSGGGEGGKQSSENMCVGLLIEHRRSGKTGF